ncbi:MAG: hypothetical protein M0Z78_08790 [Betaproteobacteria bacterium]|nr:hypothetical protein [Betaproteobacteria bacterium]
MKKIVLVIATLLMASVASAQNAYECKYRNANTSKPGAFTFVNTGKSPLEEQIAGFLPKEGYFKLVCMGLGDNRSKLLGLFKKKDGKYTYELNAKGFGVCR